VSQARSWGLTSRSFLAAVTVAVVGIAAWAVHVWRIPNPLVNLHTLSNKFVRTAQVASLFSGIGVHLLLSTIIRYVQTPASTGYGPGRSVVVAGVILMPFSTASLVVSRSLPRLRALVGEARVMPLGCLTFAAAMLIFGVARSGIWEWLLVLGLAGLGVGAIFASMPSLIIRGVPSAETGSSLGFNQVLRIVGASIGSATSAAVLAAHTANGAVYPTSGGYTMTAMLAIGVWLVTMTIAFVVPRGGSTSPADMPSDLQELELESVEAGVVGAVIHEIEDPVRRRR
jgi:MFS family permease